MPGALDHLLVLDLTSHLSGPYCAMLLADHGAEVLKIEPPTGDSARNMPPFINVTNVQQQLEVDIDNASDVFSSLDVASHPVKRMGDAA